MKMVSEPVFNEVLTKKYGFPVVKWDVLHIPKTCEIKFTWISVDSSWRQGVWMFADLGLSISGRIYKSVELWSDNSPSEFLLRAESTDGKLHLYNIWDSGNGRESQSYTSGMIVSGEGRIRHYRCNDIGLETDFSKLAFVIEIVI